MVGVRVVGVRFEHHREAVGIGEARPRVSWRVETAEPDWTQAAYEIEIAGEAGVETSGRVDSDEMVLVDWPATALASRERRTARVRVWSGGEAEPSAWSERAEVETGLLEIRDWSAVPVGPERDLGERLDRPPILFRREFELSGEVADARLYVTAHGVYAAELNGRRVGDHVLAPGWTSYHHRLRYQTFDVTALVARGSNVLAATVAEGWYCGHLGFHGGRRRIWGDDVALIAQLEVRYADGRRETIATDGVWRWADGPLLASGIYAGETYDARRELPGWSAPGFDETAWEPVRVLAPERARLVAPDGPPVRRIEEVRPAGITEAASGGWIVDFGQNLVGRVRLRVRGDRGTTISLHHAEVLEAGDVATRPLRGAAAIDRYILRGQQDREPETWEPEFTFHGFRYVRVDGWPGEPSADDLVAIVTHTDMERTGWFGSSEPLLDRLHENIVWTMRSNYLDIPSDCPQRDERLGWAGDLGLFAPTGTFVYDCSGLLRSWLRDVAVEAAANDGTVPLYVPWFQLTWPAVPVAVWGDGAVVVPWVLFERFGDLGLLAECFPTMAAWIDRVSAFTGERHLWTHGLQLGDWLDPDAPADAPERAKTDPYLIATAYHAWTAAIVARVAELLGRDEDARRFHDLAEAVRGAFRREYVAPSGRLVSDAQTAYALALEFDLLPSPEQRERAGRRLADLVRLNDHKIGTGLVGTRAVCDALVDAGEADTAYHLLLRRVPPSWLYPVTMGATTVWERWDSMLPDGSLNPGDMLSFNHCALGAIGDWLHRTVAGLSPAEPGYRRLLVAPIPGGGLEHAAATHLTPYGRASVSWQRRDGRLDVELLVPPGSTATIRLPAPDWREVQVGSGTHRFSCAYRAVHDDPPRPAAPEPLGLPPESDVFES